MSSVMNHTELDSHMGTHAELSHTSPDAGSVPPANHPAPGARRGSKGPLQRVAREVEAAAATAPRHFSRAILCSQRAGLGTSSTARSTESLVVQLSKQARVERGRPSRWQSWVPSAW